MKIINSAITSLFYATFVFSVSLSLSAQTSVDQALNQAIAESYIEDFVQSANRVQYGVDISYPIGKVTVADECKVFLTKEMFVGAEGQEIFNQFKTHQSALPNLVQGGTLNNYCPRYSKMNIDQKALVWTMILTMVAHFESSCKITAKAKGPNGTAYGYYQLHLGKEQKYDGDLNLCVQNASKNGKLSGICTLAMLQRQFERSKNVLFFNSSYWDVLRPNGHAQRADDIQRSIMNSSMCSPKYL